MADEPVNLAAARQRLESAKQPQPVAESASRADPMTALCKCIGDIAATLSIHEKLAAANSAELVRLGACIGLLLPLLRGLGETMQEVLRRLPPAASDEIHGPGK